MSHDHVDSETQRYYDFLGQVSEGSAGWLRPSDHESSALVLERLKNAASSSGDRFVIKCIDDDIYFWRNKAYPVGAEDWAPQPIMMFEVR